MSCAPDEWDAFVERQPWGAFEQTTNWAEAKAASDWKGIVSVVRDEGSIAAGFHMLWRPFMAGRRIAYITKGPVFDFGKEDDRLAAVIAGRIVEESRRLNITALVVQPPPGSHAFGLQARRQGFLTGVLPGLIRATYQLDLGMTEEDLLARMRRDRRRNARNAERGPLRFVEGDDAGLPTFFSMMTETCRRQNTNPNPGSLDLLSSVWRAFRRQDRIRLFFACHDDTPVSGAVVITFGERATIWKIGWTGMHGKLYPNDFLHWKAIKWARGCGYRRFDFVAIDTAASSAEQEEEPLPMATGSPSFFKLGFNGETVVFPEPAVYFSHRLLRSVCGLAWRCGLGPESKTARLLVRRLMKADQ